MLVDFTRVKNIFIVCVRTDMLKGMDGLASIVQYEYNMDLFDDAILFCGGKSERFKALYWDGDGFILLYKRINDGKLKWPRKPEEIMKLSVQQLRWVLEGLSIIWTNTVKKSLKTIFKKMKGITSSNEAKMSSCFVVKWGHLNSAFSHYLTHLNEMKF